MDRTELEQRTRAAVGQLLAQKGYVACLDVFLALGRLSPADQEAWRHRRVSCLERVIGLNLNQISAVCHQVRVCAREAGLKPSCTAYVSWGRAPRVPLQFTKSGAAHLERAWSTHQVRPQPKTATRASAAY